MSMSKKTQVGTEGWSADRTSFHRRRQALVFPPGFTPRTARMRAGDTNNAVRVLDLLLEYFGDACAELAGAMTAIVPVA